jgi:hypothetical protein
MTAKERAAYERCLKIVNKTEVPLDGYERFGDRSHFASYNLGRFQQAVVNEITAILYRRPSTKSRRRPS